MAIIDAFVGAPQSQLAGYAFLLTLIVVGIAVLVGKESIPLSQKFIVVLLMVLMALPAILLTLLQVTCMVTGDAGGNKWWCTVYAWYISIVIVFSSAIVIIGAIMSMIEEKKVEKFVNAKAKVAVKEAYENMDAAKALAVANKQAREYFESKGSKEKFENEGEAPAVEGGMAPTEVGMAPAMEEPKKRPAAPVAPGPMGPMDAVPTPEAFAATETFTSSCAAF